MLEIACFSAADAQLAAASGASRVEICQDYSTGGTSPTAKTLRAIRQHWQERSYHIPIHVMVRPRPGNFCYSDEEFTAMLREVESWREQALADGFVFGVLTDEGNVDEPRARLLIEAAAPLKCTFHRAIDEVSDLDVAMDAVLRCGCSAVLSSGGKSSAAEGMDRLQEMIKKCGSLGIDVIPGGGIRRENVREIRDRTGAVWVHSAARVDGKLNAQEVGAIVRQLTASPKSDSSRGGQV